MNRLVGMTDFDLNLDLTIHDLKEYRRGNGNKMGQVNARMRGRSTDWYRPNLVVQRHSLPVSTEDLNSLLRESPKVSGKFEISLG